jgi:hypothetical protein
MSASVQGVQPEQGVHGKKQKLGKRTCAGCAG